MSKTVNEKEFCELLAGEKAVIADFYSDTCIPCRAMAPVFEAAAEKLAESAEFVKINVAQNMPLAVKYEVTAVPCIIAFVNGEEADRLIGACGAEDFEDFVQGVL